MIVFPLRVSSDGHVRAWLYIKEYLWAHEQGGRLCADPCLWCAASGQCVGGPVVGTQCREGANGEMEAPCPNAEGGGVQRCDLGCGVLPFGHDVWTAL